MTTINPEAFDRKPLIEAIKATKKALDDILNEAECGDLEMETLQIIDGNLVKLRQLINERAGLLDVLRPV